MTNNAQALAKACDTKAKKVGQEWLIRCPSPYHDDKNPSCRLRDGDSGQLLWHCFSCEDQDGVRKGLEARGYKPNLRLDSRSILRQAKEQDDFIARFKEAKKEQDNEDAMPEGGPITMADVCAQDWPPDEPLIGPINRGKIVMFVAPTGVGKTFLAHSLADAMSEGKTCGKWPAKGSHTVTVVDGEMSGTDFVRIKHTVNVEGNYRLIASSLQRARINLMEEFWQDWLFERVCDQDCVIFDNMYSLFPTTENVKSTGAEYMTIVQGLIDRLKHEGTTSILFDHTGKSGTQFGSASKTWGCDLVGMMLRGPKDDFEQGVAGFNLSFAGEDQGKCRGQWIPSLHNRLRWVLAGHGGWVCS